MKNNSSVLISPLDWGLGHAARSAPLITKFADKGCNVTVFASSEICNFLQERFPDINYITDKTTPITYGFGGTGFFKTLSIIFKINKQIKTEQDLCASLCANNNFDLIVSDNRYGFRNKNVKSVLITHQLAPIPPWWLYFGKFILIRFLKKTYKAFSEVWIPDNQNDVGLAGKLSHPGFSVPNAKYIGALSRFTIYKKPTGLKNEDFILIITSGPEKHRNEMARKFSEAFKNIDISVVIVGTKVEGNFTNIRFNKSVSDEEMFMLLLKACIIISHSGYSTIMDLFAVGRSAIVFPTKGQTEQKYLAQLHKDYFINYKVLNKNRIDFKYFIKILKEKEILMYNKNIKFY